MDVDEYVEGSVVFVYGFSWKTLVGELYGPSLWFNCATLNNILGDVFLVSSSKPVLCKTPSTSSPTSNTPLVIEISKSFGTQNLDTSTPSKNAYTLVSGLSLFDANCTFLDLI